MDNPKQRECVFRSVGGEFRAQDLRRGVIEGTFHALLGDIHGCLPEILVIHLRAPEQFKQPGERERIITSKGRRASEFRASLAFTTLGLRQAVPSPR